MKLLNDVKQATAQASASKDKASDKTANAVRVFTDKWTAEDMTDLIKKAVKRGQLEECTPTLEEIQTNNGVGYKITVKATDGTIAIVTALMSAVKVQDKLNNEREKANKRAEKLASKQASAKACTTAMSAILYLAENLEDAANVQALRDAYSVITDFAAILASKEDVTEAVKRYNEKRYNETHAVKPSEA